MDPGKYQADVILVMWHLQRANYDQALKAIASLEKKQPDNPLTYNLKASIYTAKKDIAMARKLLERALELQPTYVPAAVNLAQLDLQEKNPKLARQRLEAILEKDKNNVQAMLALANLAPRIRATPKEAIGWLERAVAASSGALQPQLMLARAYAKEGELKKAMDVAQRAQSANPESAESLDTLGTLQIAAGEKEQAIATYGKLVKLQPDSPLALYRLASAEALGGDTAKAANTLMKALSFKPDFQDAQRALVELKIRAGQHSEAVKIAQQVQKQAAKSPLGYVLEGDARMGEKNYAQAIKSYETAFGMAKSGALLIKLHAASTLGGKRAEADARLTQWLKDSPEDVGVRLYAADVSLRDGNNKRAIEQYEFVLRKQPDNVLVLNNLAWAYQQAKDSRALEMAERAYKLKPDSPDVTDTLGWMLSEQGNTSRGVELLQKAVAAAPGAQAIRFHLAQTYLKTGDKAKARTELERIESTGTKFPEEAEAVNLLKQLRK
jgi:putative PEP-CTERM system TPR-repeat lipoprotein